MRTTVSKIVALCLLVALGGCKKSFIQQSNPNGVNPDNGYKTEGDITAGVYGVYQSLRSGNCIGEGAQLWTDDRADDINTTDNQSNNGEPYQFTAFSIVPSNSYLKSHWISLYTPIGRVNTLLNYIDGVTFANAATKQQFKGEMKFLRAYMYFMLVREFGDVPLVDVRATTLDQANKLDVRASKDTVYASIIADLKDALNAGLPVTQTAANKGRVSLQTVNATLGLVYLTMGNTLTAGRTENWNNAKTYLLAAYNQKTFNSLSDVPYADVFDVSKKYTCPELIWIIDYKQGDQNYSSSLAKNNQAKGTTINSLFVSQGDGQLFTADLLKEFETGDLRTDTSVKKAATGRYFVTKFRDNSAAAGTNGYGGNAWILIRYADVILNLAEASNRLGDDAAAVTYLNMVRARAQRPDYATMMATDANYAARYPSMKLAILHERRVELAFEHHRWHDLIRTFTPDELVAYFKAKNQADYDNSPLSNINTKDYYFPIPLYEVTINPVGMKQNPGY